MSARSSRALPEGLSCDSCFAFGFCRGIGVAKEGQTECDWHPIRYQMDLRRLSLEQRRAITQGIAEQEQELEARKET